MRRSEVFILLVDNGVLNAYSRLNGAILESLRVSLILPVPLAEKYPKKGARAKWG
jgi:hypothetical protein